MPKVDPILVADNIEKSFPGVKALQGVSLQCFLGEVLGLVGENGAGKSTLMNILTGVLQPDKGQISIDNQPYKIYSPEIARKLGIRIVYQEFSLFPHMTIAENIKLNHEPHNRFGAIDIRQLYSAAELSLRKVSASLSIDTVIEDLSPAEQQLVEIAKAIDGEPRILILDEPTASLSKSETEKLLEVVGTLRGQGISIIFISHRLEEVIEACDRVVIMKDGTLVGSLDKSEFNREVIISMMVGREMSQIFPEHRQKRNENVVFEVDNISCRDKFSNINLKIHEGEILGIGGLEGQGQRDLIRGIFGINPIDNGIIKFSGKKVKINSPQEAMQAGMAFISDDRKKEGLVLHHSISENMVITILHKICSGIFLNKSFEKQVVENNISKLSIKASSRRQLAYELSGGNQQKVILAKWLGTAPKLLILDEPTRGIDIQSKMQIYQLISNISAQGTAVLLVTSDMLELIGLSDRIVILYEGHVAGELSSIDANEEKIMSLSSGMTNAKREEP